jgi:membrane protease YdiL (CAAX protease family)
MGNKFFVALIIFAVWILITLFGPRIQMGSHAISLNDLVSRSIALWLAVACIFLFAAVAVLGWWRQVGLRAAQPTSWRLTWFPFLLILILLAMAGVLGFPASTIVLFVLVNTLLVGISEELMTRGVLFYGALTRFGIWSTIVIVSVLFGAMHLGNGFITGEWGTAALQAVTAAMSGLLFLALRMRTNSLIPGIVVHWIWDFAVFMASSPRVAPTAGAPELSMTLQLTLPLVLATPSFLYGLWLLRHIGKRDKAEFISQTT